MTTENQQMLAQLQALHDAYHGKIGDIDDRVDAILGDIGGVLFDTFYVNAVTGSDVNDGLAADRPLQTVNAAMARMIAGGSYVVVLQTDVVIDRLFNTRARTVAFQSNVTGTKREMTIASERADVPGDARLPSFQSASTGFMIQFFNIRLRFPVAAAHVTARYFIHTSAMNTIHLRNCEIVRDAGANTSLANGFLGIVAIALDGTTFPTEMAGHWLEGYLAGTDPATVDFLLTKNITSL